MKRYRVITHPIVEHEIDEALAFIAVHSPDNAAKWVNSIEEPILSLTELPVRCPLAPGSENFPEEIRHLIVGAYRILVTVVGNEVHVLHDRHGARKPIDPQDN